MIGGAASMLARRPVRPETDTLASPPGARDKSSMVRVLSLILLAGLLWACSPSRLSHEQLSRVVDAERGSLDACYDAALQKQPDKRELTGQANIRVAPSGEVAAVEIEGDLPLAGLKSCLREAIAGWRFPPAKDETRTALPLDFKPQVVNAPAM